MLVTGLQAQTKISEGITHKNNDNTEKRSRLHKNAHFEGILPKGPYPPCLRMADRALLAGYPRFMSGGVAWYISLLCACLLVRNMFHIHCVTFSTVTHCWGTDPPISWEDLGYCCACRCDGILLNWQMWPLGIDPTTKFIQRIVALRLSKSRIAVVVCLYLRFHHCASSIPGVNIVPNPHTVKLRMDDCVHPFIFNAKVLCNQNICTCSQCINIHVAFNVDIGEWKAILYYWWFVRLHISRFKNKSAVNYALRRPSM